MTKKQDNGEPVLSSDSGRVVYVLKGRYANR